MVDEFMLESITANIDDQFLHLVKYEIFDTFLHAIDSYKMIQNRLWKILEKNPSINEQIRVLNSLTNVIDTTNAYVFDTRVIQQFKRTLNSRFAQLERLPNNHTEGLCN